LGRVRHGGHKCGVSFEDLQTRRQVLDTIDPFHPGSLLLVCSLGPPRLHCCSLLMRSKGSGHGQCVLIPQPPPTATIATTQIIESDKVLHDFQPSCMKSVHVYICVHTK